MASDVKIGISVDATAANAGFRSIGKNLDTVAESVQGATNEMRHGMDTLESSVKSTSAALPKLGQEARKAAHGLKNAGADAQKMASRLGRVESGAGETASVMSGLAGALSIVSPEAAAAAQGLADAAGGVEAVSKVAPGLLSVLGPVAVAAGIAGLAFKKYSDELKEAEARMVTAAKKAQMVGKVFGSIKTERARVALELAVSEGEATAEDLVRYNAEQRSAAVFAGGRASAVREIVAAQAALAVATAEQARLSGIVESIAVDDKGRASSRRQLAIRNRSVVLLQSQNKLVGSLSSKLESQKGIAQKIVNLQKQNTREIVKRAANLAKTTGGGGGGPSKAAQLQAKADQARLANVKSQSAALATLRKAQRAAHVDGLEGEEKLAAVYKDRIDALRNVAGQHVLNEKVHAAMVAAQQELEIRRDTEISELRAKTLADLTNARDKRDEDRRRRHAEELSEVAELKAARMAAMSELTGNTAQLFDALSQNVSGMDRDMAKRLFTVSKAFTVSQIGLSTAEGLMTAAALPPPIDAIKAGAVLAQAGASLAIVAAQKPSFHAGTGMVRSPGQRRELNARLRAGEAVSTPLGAEIIGRGNIERANAGIGGSGGGSPVVFQYEHRVFSRFIRDNARMRGPLSSEINRGKNTGHRG
mgnify:CR=1 FL=1